MPFGFNRASASRAIELRQSTNVPNTSKNNALTASGMCIPRTIGRLCSAFHSAARRNAKAAECPHGWFEVQSASLREGRCKPTTALGGRLSTGPAVGGRWLPAWKLGAAPVPQHCDFLCRPAAAGIFGDAETAGESILKIHARRQHRFGQNAKLGQAFCGLARARAAVAGRALVENECGFPLG